ncbi:ribokinase [Thermosipho ferrireducens]|uniref:Ribokinase n=1 Tax=Thermosipho ferrireducens TaxID=2571116 RepID=A0ABX7S835_9BACT|nr:ribokinase [Thermosipho ferrireducens]QTA37443.1 ribokinase [Thermosipho ferrireducens]
MISIVGSSNMDIVLNVKKFTLPGETQKAMNLHYFPGGKGANQAVTVARLTNFPVLFLTCLGNDSYGAKLRESYNLLKIRGYEIVNDYNGLAFIEVTEQGENRIIIYPGANRKLSIDLVLKKKEMLLKNDIVLLQNEIPFKTSLEVAKLFKENGKLVIFDPAPVEGIEKEIFRYVDFLTPNEEETKLLSNKFFGKFISFDESFKNFQEFGLKRMIIKLGEAGVLYFDGSRKVKIPAFKVKAKDTTAAGDVFNGAFAVALFETKNIEYSLIFACAASAISVTRSGAQTSIPERKEVERFLEKNLKEKQILR